MNQTKPLVLRDEIHGDLTFDGVMRAVIDHEYFQRLRRIKQLGLAEYVFPCANHTRFQHSLGAAFLAGQYFDSMVTSWLSNPFPFDGTSGGTRFHASRTLECIRSVMADPKSAEYWRRIVSLSGLLHDVGHGPWSHTFEHLELKQKFDQSLIGMPATIVTHFDEIKKSGKRIKHEELSLLYAYRILRSIGEQGVISEWKSYFLPIAMLINRKMSAGPLQKALENEVSDQLKGNGIKGGIDFHRLLRPLVSGPFDVDRIDYIQRDGRNCGVHIAGIEWRRIVSKLMPCLADHAASGDEPKEVVLISNIKNQHVIDDFIFTLLQMYAQVYLHPKIVGLEEVIKSVILKYNDRLQEFEITLDQHALLSDEKFRDVLEFKYQMSEITRLLNRHPGTRFEVARYPAGDDVDTALAQEGFHSIPHLDRPFLKDSVGVFLYSEISENNSPRYFVRPWSEISPVASQFASFNYSPHIWIRVPTSPS